jgi:hypothetical protein
MRPDVRRVATLRYDARLGPRRTVCIHLLGAVCLVVVLALAALQTRPGLGTNADTVANLDVLDLGTDTEGLSNDLWTL